MNKTQSESDSQEAMSVYIYEKKRLYNKMVVWYIDVSETNEGKQ
jgi:hypothetical protein